MSIRFPKPAADIVAAPPVAPPDSGERVVDQRISIKHAESSAPEDDEDTAGLIKQADLGNHKRTL